MLMGLAMGATILAIVLSPWGKQSGAHFNPAVTFTFYRLRKVALWDAVFYCAAQLLGAVAGVALASLVLQGAPAHKAVRYAATIPGIYGDTIAFVAELAISFILMGAILFASNHEVLAPYTHYFAAILVAVYIAFESPLSGMSTNPARTFGPALYGPGHGAGGCDAGRPGPRQVVLDAAYVAHPMASFGRPKPVPLPLGGWVNKQIPPNPKTEEESR